jgi:hypothetical protein
MAVAHCDVVNTPPFAGAAFVAGHPPAKYTIHNKQWQVYCRRYETTRVATPRLATSNGAASADSDCRVIAACDKRAADSGIGDIREFAIIDIEG